jgi:hypothetical protein
MRFRKDGWHYADLKVQGKTFDEYYSYSESALQNAEYRKFWDECPKAEPGDVWRIYWYHHDDQGHQLNDWIAGYAICCLGCGRVHPWTQALNCGQKIQTEYGESCIHVQNRTSCWTWTGSAEEGTLTASPSLQVVKERCEWGCGWHGYIQNGDLHT